MGTLAAGDTLRRQAYAFMSLIQVAVVLIVVGFLLWFVNSLFSWRVP